MKHIGTQVLNFRVPALVDRQITYLHGQQFLGQFVALCFVLDAQYLSPALIEYAAAQFQRVGATLIMVGSTRRPLHRLRIDQTHTVCVPVLADPCGRLHRTFGVAHHKSAERCRTFMIDTDGILWLRISHAFAEHDLVTIRRIIEAVQQHPITSTVLEDRPMTSQCLEA